MADERDFDDFDTQVQSDEPTPEPEYDGGYDNPIEQGAYDDDPSPYDGTYSEE